VYGTHTNFFPTNAGFATSDCAFCCIRASLSQKNFEARLQVKKEAFLDALNILDAQTSYYFRKQGALLQTVEIEDIRATFSKLLICTDNPEIYKKFAEFFSHKKIILTQMTLI
jgi:hypothetical protein